MNYQFIEFYRLMLLIVSKNISSNVAKYYNMKQISPKLYTKYSVRLVKHCQLKLPIHDNIRYSLYNINSAYCQYLSSNPSNWARKLLKNNPKSIDWYRLSSNPSNWAHKLLRIYPDKIYWYGISINKSIWAYKLLKANPDKIYWYGISRNESVWAHKLLKKYFEKNIIEKRHLQSYLSLNCSDYIGKSLILNPERIHWDFLSQNSSYWAYELLKANPEKIDRDMLIFNPSLSTIHLLKNTFTTGMIYSPYNMSDWALDLFMRNMNVIDTGESLFVVVEDFNKYL